MIYAHRAEFDEHPACLARLKELAESPLPFAVPVFCVSEFLRVVTHPKVFDPPSARTDAWGFLEALLGSPSARLIGPGSRFMTELRTLMEDANVSGNLVFDAQIVAVLVEHGVNRILSADRDMRRFSAVEVLNPV